MRAFASCLLHLQFGSGSGSGTGTGTDGDSMPLGTLALSYAATQYTLSEHIQYITLMTVLRVELLEVRSVCEAEQFSSH